MFGAICGDIIGSRHEFAPVRSKDFALFDKRCFPTDDTLLTLAVCGWLLDGDDLVTSFKRLAREYPRCGWGGRFARWAASDDRSPYNSFGNGSAMRVSPVGWVARSLDEALDLARASAVVTHDHPEGVRGAESVAACVYLARTGASKSEIRAIVEARFGYDLSPTAERVRAVAHFDETCQVSVPEAIIAFLDSDGFEDAVRTAVSFGADADTQACIAGGIAHAFDGRVPAEIRHAAMPLLDDWMIELVARFEAAFGGS